MHTERPTASMLCAVVLGLAALLVAGCDGKEAVDAFAPIPSVTPEPAVISFQIAGEQTDFADSMPTPTPTPLITPTPIPFSHYAPTVNMSFEELVGSTTDMKAKQRDLLKDGYPDPKTYYIIVDKQWQVTMVFKRIDDGTKFGQPDYSQPVRYMICSTGNPDKEHGNETTSGIFAIEPVKERFRQFVNLEAAQYWTLIRSRTYFHSVLYEKAYDLNSLVPESYTELGTKASHACIRLTVPDARWLFYNIGHGTTCEVRDGSFEDVETAAIRAQLILPPYKNVRLKASDELWTDNWRIEDVAHEMEYKYMEPRMPDMGQDDAGDALPALTPDAGGITVGGDGGATGGDGGATGGDDGSTGGGEPPVGGTYVP